MCFSTSHTEKTEKPATALHREGVCKQGDTVPAKGEERRMEQNRIEQTSGTQNLSECPSGTISPVLWSRKDAKDSKFSLGRRSIITACSEHIVTTQHC